MSFSFVVSGHAGKSVEATNEDEGAKVASLMETVLAKARELDLDSIIQSPNPSHWVPAKLDNYLDTPAEPAPEQTTGDAPFMARTQSPDEPATT